MHDHDFARLLDLLASPMFLPDARRLAETMARAESVRRRLTAGEGSVTRPGVTLEEPNMQKPSSSLERLGAAAVSGSSNSAASRGLPLRERGSSCDNVCRTEPLTEPTASHGAVDLTLLQDEARGGARVLAGGVVGACVMIAFFYALAVFS